MDAHNLAAYQNAFRCHADHLEAKKLFAEHFTPLVRDRPVVVVSPDVGGIKRAEAFRSFLAAVLNTDDVSSAFMEKHRSAGVVSGEAVVGDIQGKTAIIIDDLISSGGTIARTAQACRQRGADTIYAAATHGLFVADAGKILSAAPLQQPSRASWSASRSWTVRHSRRPPRCSSWWSPIRCPPSGWMRNSRPAG